MGIGDINHGAEPIHVHGRPADEPTGPMTFEEFLELEQQSEFKHEFVDGYAYPHGDWATGPAGAGTRHNPIATELIRLLGNAAAGRRACFVYAQTRCCTLPTSARATTRMSSWCAIQATTTRTSAPAHA
jgi:Uma2 family endonuclease